MNEEYFGYEPHPIVNAAPSMGDLAFSEFCKSIVDVGQQVPAFIWNNQLVDGRHRLKTCYIHGIEPKIEDISHLTEIQMIKVVAALNIERRHMTDSQKAAYGAEVIEITSTASISSQKAAIEAFDRAKNLQDIALHRPEITQTQLAREQGISQSMVNRALNTDISVAPPEIKLSQREIAADIGVSNIDISKASQVKRNNPVLFEAMKEGKVGIAEAYHHRDTDPVLIEAAIEKMDEEPLKLGRAVQAVERQELIGRQIERVAEMEVNSKRLELHCCDVGELSEYVAADSVDIIITDPPYSRDYNEAWKRLGEFAVHALKPKGMMVVMGGNESVLDMANFIKLGGGVDLTLRWLVTYKTGSRYVNYRQIYSWAKQLLVYHKVKNGWDVFHDMPPFSDIVDYEILQGDVESQGQTRHRWGQQLKGFLAIVDNFCVGGETICDPFLGGGTTGVAALYRHRYFIGGEINRDILGIARARLTEEATNIDRLDASV